MLVATMEEAVAWADSALLQALKAESFICIPIQLEGEAHLAVLATTRKAQAAFSAEDEQLFGLLARQAAVTLQNLKLIQETSKRLTDVSTLLDFNRQLGSLDSAHALQTLLVVLPFRYCLAFPIEIVLGGLTPEQIAQGLVIQFAWVGVFFALFQLVWRRGLKSYGAVGA